MICIHKPQRVTHIIAPISSWYMKFLSVEDLTSAYEAVLFPQAYDRFGGLLRGRGPYLLRGRVARDAGAVSFSVDELENVG